MAMLRGPSSRIRNMTIRTEISAQLGTAMRGATWAPTMDLWFPQAPAEGESANAGETVTAAERTYIAWHGYDHEETLLAAVDEVIEWVRSLPLLVALDRDAANPCQTVINLQIAAVPRKKSEADRRGVVDQLQRRLPVERKDHERLRTRRVAFRSK